MISYISTKATATSQLFVSPSFSRLSPRQRAREKTALRLRPPSLTCATDARSRSPKARPSHPQKAPVSIGERPREEPYRLFGNFSPILGIFSVLSGKILCVLTVFASQCVSAFICCDLHRVEMNLPAAAAAMLLWIFCVRGKRRHLSPSRFSSLKEAVSVS